LYTPFFNLPFCVTSILGYENKLVIKLAFKFHKISEDGFELWAKRLRKLVKPATRQKEKGSS